MPFPPNECDTPDSQADYFEDVALAQSEVDAEKESQR